MKNNNFVLFDDDSVSFHRNLNSCNISFKRTVDYSEKHYHQRVIKLLSTMYTVYITALLLEFIFAVLISINPK